MSSRKIWFCNKGAVDVRALLTFGVSIKESDDAIGYFGTGFKYAVAIILRLGGKITVSTATGTPEDPWDTYEFTVTQELIRGREQNMVRVNGKEAGFTTHLGINWEPWMAYRELYCNAIDEGGGVTDGSPADFDGQIDTIIEVESNELWHVYKDQDTYFLKSKPLTFCGGVEFHDRPGNYVYYQGIAVGKLTTPSLLTYNLTEKMELSEERMAKDTSEPKRRIENAVQKLEDKDQLYRILSRESDQAFEKNLSFSSWITTSNAFYEVCGILSKTQAGMNDSARSMYIKHSQKNGQFHPFDLSPLHQKTMERAKTFLLKLGVNVDDFEVVTVIGLGPGVMGRALHGTIYISDLAFNMGTKQVASTLLEEWVHLTTGASDFDRLMQNWLFDKVLSLGEELSGEPL